MDALSQIAEIAPAIPLPAHARQTYSYLIPPGAALKTFQEVSIPFGARRVSGYVLKVTGPAKNRFPLKTLVPLDHPALSRRQVEFARWIARTCHGGLGYTLRLFRPPSASPRLKAPTAPILIVAPEVWLVEKIFRRLPRPYHPLAAVYHSELSASAQAKVGRLITLGQLQIVVGTQKSLFLPWTKLGLVVIAEEFLPTHKLWDQYPRLDNRYGARQLAGLYGALFHATSSFPSLNMYFQENIAASGMKKPNPINKTIIKAASFPSLKFRLHVTASSFEDKLHRRPLPNEFIAALHRWQNHGDRILLLANRRQTGSFLYCSACRKGVPCPNCFQIMPAPARQTRPVKKVPVACPRCLAAYAKLACPGCGSTRLAARSRPLANLVSILQKNGFSPLFFNAASKINRGKLSGLVVSTTAIFSSRPEQVFDRLVWVFPELDLSFPDYRSTELALYTLARLSRHNAKPRRALELVTRRPDLVNPLASQSVAKVWDKILRERRRHSYPPLTDLVKLTVNDKTAVRAHKKASDLRSALDKKIIHAGLDKNIHIRGPFPSAFPKSGEKPAAHLLLAGSLSELVPLYEDLNFTTADLAPHRIL